MKHLFAPSNLALLAKEKGFDEPCFGYYSLSHTTEEYNFHMCGEYTHFRDHYINFVGEGLRNSDMTIYPDGRQSKCMTAPLYQQLIDWFREKEIKIIGYRYDNTWEICLKRYNAYRLHGSYSTIDEAIEYSLKNLL